MLGCFGLIWSQHTRHLFRHGRSPSWRSPFRSIDVALSIGRRFLRAVPIFEGDRSHIHHMVLGLGFSTRKAAFVLYGVCALCASLALLTSLSHKGFAVVILLLFCVLVLVGVDRLGYVEFNAARRALSHTAARRAVSNEIYLHELTQALLEADSVNAWWTIARGVFMELGFASVDLEVYGCSFQENFMPTNRKHTCLIHLDLGEHGFMVLTRMPEAESPKVMMDALGRLQSSIEQRPVSLTFDAARHPANRLRSNAANAA